MVHPLWLAQLIPLSNVQIFLNTNITSRIYSDSGNLSEATMMIDEPYPGCRQLPYRNDSVSRCATGADRLRGSQ